MDEKKDYSIKGLYTKLVAMDDSPHRIALGLGVGVWVGILPGTGPAVALGLAFLLPMNKAAALLGSILTNTWLTLVTFFLALKIGAALLGLSWADIESQAQSLIKNFSWQTFFDASLVNILKPLGLGYIVVGFICGLCAYILAFIVLKQRQQMKR